MKSPFDKVFRRSAFALLGTLCVLAGATTLLAEDAPAPQVGGLADTIFYGGTVVTVDPDSTRAEAQALAIANGKIIAVGTNDLVMEKKRPDGKTNTVDLKGKTLMPGFVEPHTHVIQTAFNEHANLVTNLSSFESPMNPGTIPAIIARLRNAIKNGAPEGGWLLAWGVDPARTEPFMDALDAVKLDAVSKEIPIFVLNQSGHIAYVNHKAIQVAGIKPGMKPDGGGEYETNAEGELTGVLFEPPAYVPFQAKFAPPMKTAVAERMPQALKDTYESFAKSGVTTATELGLGVVLADISEELELLKTMAIDPQTPLRIRADIDVNVAGREKQKQVPCSQDRSALTSPPPLLAVIGAKFFADGSNQGLSGKLKKPYNYPAGTTNTGLLNYPDEAAVNALFQATKRYMDAGCQLSFHSNGDRATSQVLEVYDRLLHDHPNLKDLKERRFRIEHLTVTDEAQIKEIQRLGLTPSMTIGHVYYWGYAFDEQNILGSERAQRIDPSYSLRKLGIRFSFNSDSPITPVSPLRYISTAVTRLWQHKPQKALDKPQVPGAGSYDGQKISIDDAIRAVTLDAAYQLFLDNDIGSLEVGKWADLVILEKNPRTFKTNFEEIMNIRVHSTYLSGVQKYLLLPQQGSLQNDANKEYRCNRATHLAKDYTGLDCLMRLTPYGNGVFAIQNVKTGEYFQDHIGTMAGKVESDRQKWKIVSAAGGYTIQNVFNHEYMTSHASQLSETAGPDEIWNIAERPNP